MKSRKADLSLSVNSIIILIFAVTILGLGLAFIKGSFSKITKTVPQEYQCTPATAGPGEPVTLCPDIVRVSPGQTAGVIARVYNVQQDTALEDVKPAITCDTSTIMTYKSNSISIQAGATQEFQIPITINRGAEFGTYLCQLTVLRFPPIDFRIDVEK